MCVLLISIIGLGWINLRPSNQSPKNANFEKTLRITKKSIIFTGTFISRLFYHKVANTSVLCVGLLTLAWNKFCVFFSLLMNLISKIREFLKNVYQDDHLLPGKWVPVSCVDTPLLMWTESAYFKLSIVCHNRTSRLIFDENLASVLKFIYWCQLKSVAVVFPRTRCRSRTTPRPYDPPSTDDGFEWESRVCVWQTKTR